MNKILVNERRLLGAVAKWGVEQSPYYRPDNLEVVLDKLHSQTIKSWEDGELGYIDFPDSKSLREFIKDNLRQIPEYVAWNDRKNGNSAEYKFTSIYDTDDNPDDDFIDLDALEANVTSEIINHD